MNLLPVPEASAAPTEHADWLEALAIAQPNFRASHADLLSALKQTGSVDALVDDDLSDTKPLDVATERENELLEGISEAAFDVLQSRREYLGPQYPFALTSSLVATVDALTSPYAFLSALSLHPYESGPFSQNGATLFEQACTSALREYLGGKERARAMHFGFPRRDGPNSFEEAVSQLLQGLNVGIAPTDNGFTGDEKDEKLDVVAWIPFNDRQNSQLTVFGQCSTGVHWTGKVNDLNPFTFCIDWFNKMPIPLPLVAFFVPRELSEVEWRKHTKDDRRLFFDRLRLARLLAPLDEELAEQCAQWTLEAIT